MVCVKGMDMNAPALHRRNATTGQNVYSEVQGQCTAVEKVQWPKVHCPTGQVGAAWSKGSDHTRFVGNPVRVDARVCITMISIFAPFQAFPRHTFNNNVGPVGEPSCRHGSSEFVQEPVPLAFSHTGLAI